MTPETVTIASRRVIAANLRLRVGRQTVTPK